MRQGEIVKKYLSSFYLLNAGLRTASVVVVVVLSSLSGPFY